MSISVVIVDDEYLAIKVLKKYVSCLYDLSIAATFHNPLDAVNYLTKNHVDLLLLDIQMPFLNGFELIEKLPNPPLIIFTTARHDYAVKAFDLKILDYLVKPVSFERFEQAINRAKEQLNLNHVINSVLKSPTEVEYIEIRSDYKTIRIPHSQILYIEGLNEYIKVYTTGKMHITLASLKELASKLQDKGFARIHKSYIVALHAIRSYNRRSVKLADGKELPIGRTYKNIILEWLKTKSL